MPQPCGHGRSPLVSTIIPRRTSRREGGRFLDSGGGIFAGQGKCAKPRWEFAGNQYVPKTCGIAATYDEAVYCCNRFRETRVDCDNDSLPMRLVIFGANDKRKLELLTAVMTFLRGVGAQVMMDDMPVNYIVDLVGTKIKIETSATKNNFLAYLHSCLYHGIITVMATRDRPKVEFTIAGVTDCFHSIVGLRGIPRHDRLHLEQFLFTKMWQTGLMKKSKKAAGATLFVDRLDVRTISVETIAGWVKGFETELTRYRKAS